MRWKRVRQISFFLIGLGFAQLLISWAQWKKLTFLERFQKETTNTRGLEEAYDATPGSKSASAGFQEIFDGNKKTLSSSSESENTQGIFDGTKTTLSSSFESENTQGIFDGTKTTLSSSSESENTQGIFDGTKTTLSSSFESENTQGIFEARHAPLGSDSESEDKFMERMKRRMDGRKNRLHDKCEQLGLNEANLAVEPWESSLPQPSPWFFTTKKQNLIYCEIPKSGSTNWKKILMILDGLANNTDDISQETAHRTQLTPVDSNPGKAVWELYRKSLKIIVVRDPLERLVSAYLDKVAPKLSHDNAAVFWKFSFEVARMYGNRWKDPSEEYLEDMAKNKTELKPPLINQNLKSAGYREFPLQANFDEFVSYLTDPANVNVVNDVIDHGSRMAQFVSVRHWQNFHTLCYPCHVSYDVIAHMETIDEDARYILNLINAPESLTFPRGYSDGGGRKTKSEKVDKLLSHLEPKKLLRLYQLYKNDFELFGYNQSSYVKAVKRH